MKKHFLTFLSLFLLNYCFAQNFSPDFLDGRIMFKVKGEVFANKHQTAQTDLNSFSLVENLNDYPILKEVIKDYGVTRLERPSYFTGKPGIQNIFRLTFSEFTKIDELVAELKKLNFIEFATKEPIYKTSFIPNDTYHNGTDKWYHTLVGSEAAWDISRGRSAVKIAVIDNAVGTHSDITVFRQYDVADGDADASPPLNYAQDNAWSHGTHCAGLSTADINNSRGIASLGGNVELIGIKATPNTGNSGGVWYSYDGIQWACQNGAHIVSMSFGGTTNSPAVQALIDAYPNVVFLAAAGNDGNSTVQYPAGYNNVIGVGSVNSNDARSSFSNFNGTTAFVDIASPGGYSNGGLISTVYNSSGNNSYARMGGTSMATPFAAGLVGLMLSVNPNLTPAQCLSCLLSSGVNINQNIGPRINAPAALQCARAGLVTGEPVASFYALPVSIMEGGSVNFYDNSADGGNAITTWRWSFPGGTPSSFIGQTPPAVTYATAGAYNVSLTVINGQDSSSLTRTSYINVSLEPYGEWIIQNSGFTTANRGVNHISIVDANIVWAVGYDGSGGGANVQEFTKTTDGGLTWTPGTINLGNTGLGISMIHALDASTAWVAAYPTAAGQTGGIWKTTNAGATWTRQTTATFNNAASFTNVVYFWNANEGICQGDPINGDFEIYRTTNGGTNWTAVSGANIPNPLNGNEFGYVRQIEVVGDTVWFTTSVGRIYHSTNKGQNWAVYQSPVVDFGGAINANSTANLTFGSGSRGLIVTNTGVVYQSNNGGATWTQVTTTGNVYTNGLCWIEGTDIVFSTGAATGNSGSSYSQDGGINWNIIDTDQHLYVEFINPSVGWSGWFNTSATQNGMWKWNNLSSPLSPAFSASPQRNVCMNTPVTFSDLTTGGTPTSWQWVFQGGTPSTSTAQSPSVSYSTPGVYGVILTVSDGFNQSTLQDTAYITVSAMPTQPSTITGNTTPCPFATESYSVTNVPGVFYGWNFQSGWNGMSNSNTITLVLNDTSGTVSVTADNVCGSSAPSTLSINITNIPTANFNFVDNNGNVNFTNTSTGGTSYSWDFGDNNTSTSANPTNAYAASGNYTVTLIVTNQCGISDTTTQVVNVNIVTGTDLLLDEYSNVKIFPNPSSENLTIADMPAFVLGEPIRITDVLGRVLIQTTVVSDRQTLNVNNLSSGVYTITIKEKSFKFIKG